MIVEKSGKSAKKRRRSSEVNGDSSNERENDVSLSKKIKISTEIATRSVESTCRVAKTKYRSKFGISVKSRAAEGANDDNESLLTVKKSVQFATDLITSNTQASGSNSAPSRAVLKPPSKFKDTPEQKAEDDRDRDRVEPMSGRKSLAASKEKKKLSKNAIKHIKWVKRHRKKTVSRRKRKANLKLARERPQRDVQDRVAQAIAYLNTWYDSPDTWKYRKIAQLTLIKHAFNHQLIDDDTYELLLHYLAGVQGSASDRIRSMCQQIIENNGIQPELPTLPLSIPESEDLGIVLERAKRMLEFVLPSAS